MDNFEVIRTLSTGDYFTLFEAYAKEFGIPVVLKQCVYSEVREAEFLLRSALIKTREQIYSQPPLAIFASVEQTGRETCINFVWKWEEDVDIEVEYDCSSGFPSGIDGYGKSKRIFTNPQSGMCVDRALCHTLGKKVTRCIFEHRSLLEMNVIFEEALMLAKCQHPNICGLLDIRLFEESSGDYSAYIVTESLKSDLQTEILRRKSKIKWFGEIELVTILYDISTALVHAKAQELVHKGITPSNICRNAQVFKLAGFESLKCKELREKSSSIRGSEPYVHSAVWNVNNERLQKVFDSNMHSLGMTMLHLAALKLPDRDEGVGDAEWQEVLSRAVKALHYSRYFKRLLLDMIGAENRGRPHVELVQICSYYSVHREIRKCVCMALRLRDNRNYVRAIELFAVADTTMARFLPDDKSRAINLRNWGKALKTMGRNEEALEKHAAADAIFSRFFPNDKCTAGNIRNWGDILSDLGKKKEAEKKYEAADNIYSCLFCYEKCTAVNFTKWGIVLSDMKWHSIAMEKFLAAHKIFIYLGLNDVRFANNLANWGSVLLKVEKYKNAMKRFAAAHSFYSSYCLNNINCGINLGNWGSALVALGREEEALEKYTAADNICSKYFPNKMFTAKNLMEWGSLLENMGKKAQAATKYAAARAILSNHPADLSTAMDIADCASNLVNKRRYKEAAIKCGAADTILSAHFLSDISTAKNLATWASALEELERIQEALTKYAAADAIFSTHFPTDISTATNLAAWALALDYLERFDEAVSKFAAADAIYSRICPYEMCTANNLRNTGISLYSLGRKLEAVEKFEAANAIFTLNKDIYCICDSEIDLSLVRGPRSLWDAFIFPVSHQGFYLGRYSSIIKRVTYP